MASPLLLDYPLSRFQLDALATLLDRYECRSVEQLARVFLRLAIQDEARRLEGRALASRRSA